MAIALEQVEGKICVRLLGSIDITAAAELKKALLDALTSKHEVQVDLAQVTYLDVTAVQLLWAAQRDAAVKGTALIFDAGFSDAVRSTLMEMGFQQMLAILDQPSGEMR